MTTTSPATPTSSHTSFLRKTVLGGLAAITLTGAVGFGATAFASGGDGTGPTGARAEKICTNITAIDDWLNSRITEVQHRIDYFTTMRGKAEAAGKTNLVARIDAAIARLNDRLPRLQDRLAKVDGWAATHCTTTGGTTTTSPAPDTTVASLGG